MKLTSVPIKLWVEGEVVVVTHRHNNIVKLMVITNSANLYRKAALSELALGQYTLVREIFWLPVTNYTDSK